MSKELQLWKLPLTRILHSYRFDSWDCNDRGAGSNPYKSHWAEDRCDRPPHFFFNILREIVIQTWEGWANSAKKRKWQASIMKWTENSWAITAAPAKTMPKNEIHFILGKLSAWSVCHRGNSQPTTLSFTSACRIQSVASHWSGKPKRGWSPIKK